MDSNNSEINIICCPFIQTAIKGKKADIIYIQNTALYKTNSDILDLLPSMFYNKEPEIYVFDKGGIIGKWNTN